MVKEKATNPLNIRPLLIPILLMLALSVFAPGCKGSKQEGSAEKAAAPSLSGEREGQGAPDFSLLTFDKKEIKLSSLRGNPVVINFFASWCPPCRVEAPDLQKAYMAFRGDGVQFIGIAVQDDELDTLEFLKEFKWTFPAAPDSTEEVMKAYSVLAVPKTVIVGKDGRISFTHTGPVTEEMLNREIRKAL